MEGERRDGGEGGIGLNGFEKLKVMTQHDVLTRENASTREFTNLLSRVAMDTDGYK